MANICREHGECMPGAWQMCVERYGECMLREWRNNARSRTREVECEERNHANNLNQAVDDLVSAILESDVYLTYRTELDKVKQVPGLKSQIDEFRMRNFALQSSMDNDFDKLDRIEKDYEDFRANPLVADFLAAELDLCRMIQGIDMRITAELKFE
ncbi:MAG: YlbF family regulator [Lachnospiraceae bacterium]|nr:YlbF family regulator [Lachnospiraceae bacterium]